MTSTLSSVDYGGEKDLSDVIGLIEKDLSYSIFTYRYFINNWSRLCINVCLFFFFVKCYDDDDDILNNTF